MADNPSIKDQLRSAFRDYRVDGVPGSGANEPVKAEVRAALDGVVDLALEAKDLAANAGSTIVATTRAELNGMPGPFKSGDRAEVRKDPAGDVTNGNGVYRYSGTAWVWIDSTIPASVQTAIRNDAVAAAGDRADEIVEPVAAETSRLGRMIGTGMTDEPGVILAVKDLEGRVAPVMRADGRLLQLRPDGTTAVVPLDGGDGVRSVPFMGLIQGERPHRVTVDPNQRIVSAETIEGGLFVATATGLERVSAGAAAQGSATPAYLGETYDFGKYQLLHAPAADVCLLLLTMGQSNALGTNASSDNLPGATPVYPAEALMLSGTSPRKSSDSVTATAIALKEAVEGGRETAASGWANHLIRDLEASTGRRVHTLSAVAATGSRPYRGLNRGSDAYGRMIAAVRSMVAVCRARGWTPICPGIDWMQGESDGGAVNMGDGRSSALPAADYVRGMRQFARQADADIRAITGQAERVPVFITQLARRTQDGPDGLFRDSAREAQRMLHGDGNIRLVGPAYLFDTVEDGLHLTSAGQNQRGQQVARAVVAEVFGAGWSPVIDKVHRWISDTVLEVEFEVPTLPLVIDDSGDVVATTGLTTSKGFVFTDNTGSPPTITNVAVEGDRAVRITLSAAPAGKGSCRLGYARARTGGSLNDGRLTGARGLLRDSAAHPSLYGQPAQANWCVSFIREVGRPSAAGGGGGGSGNVTGPAGATDGALAMFDGVTGELLKVGPEANSLLTQETADGRYIPQAALGVAVAPLGEDGKVPLANLPPMGGGGPSLSNTAPPALGTAAAGSSAEAARGDHVHAHGNQSGGALHALATTSAHGFMSSSDKSKLDGVQAGATPNATNAQLRDRSTHTGSQPWSTISDPPAITGMTASETNSAGTVVRRNASGRAEANRFLATGDYYYFNSTSYYMRLNGAEINFSHACTAAAFTPSSDPLLKRDMTLVDDDAAALAQVIAARQFTYIRVQDDVYAAGFDARALRDINPLWTVGGHLLDPDGSPADLDGAVVDEDGALRRPLAVDPMAIISSMAGAIRELSRRLTDLEASSHHEA